MKSKTARPASGQHFHLSRRTFLKLSSAAAAAGVFAEGSFRGLAQADALGKEKRDKMTPDEILARLKRGNKNFGKGSDDRAQLPQ